MILETNTIEEFHENGELAFTETRSFVSDSHLHLYPNRRFSDGKNWIRTGIMAKYSKEGRLLWDMMYNDKGDLIN